MSKSPLRARAPGAQGQDGLKVLRHVAQPEHLTDLTNLTIMLRAAVRMNHTYELHVQLLLFTSLNRDIPNKSEAHFELLLEP